MTGFITISLLVLWIIRTASIKRIPSRLQYLVDMACLCCSANHSHNSVPNILKVIDGSPAIIELTCNTRIDLFINQPSTALLVYDQMKDYGHIIMGLFNRFLLIQAKDLSVLKQSLRTRLWMKYIRKIN